MWHGTKYGLIGKYGKYDVENGYAGLVFIGFENTGTCRYFDLLGGSFPLGEDLKFGEPSAVDYFWLSAAFRVFVGVEVGFNFAEFLDFLLGFAYIDILGDDKKHLMQQK